MIRRSPDSVWEHFLANLYSAVTRLLSSRQIPAPHSPQHHLLIEPLRHFAPQLIIILLIVATYIPSIHQSARADQLAVLAEFSGIYDLPTILSRSFALNRHREFNPGDELLFRPLLDLTLGFETWAFRYNFIWWQLTGLALHTSVTLSLLTLLKHLYRSPSAYFLTVFFSTIYIASEAVMWHHIHGYLIFAVCILQAFRYLVDYTVHERRSTSVVIRLFAWTSAASFSHELGAVFSIFAALGTYVASRYVRVRVDGIPTIQSASHWWHHLVTIIPFSLYVVSSVAHFTLSGAHLPGAQTPISTDVTAGFINSVTAQAWWLLSGLMPTSLLLEAGGRVVVTPGDIWRFLNPAYWSVLQYINFLACILVLLTAVTAIIISATSHRLNRFLIITSVALLLAQIQTASIVLGRASGRSLGFALENAVYYSYPFWILVIVGFYSLRPVLSRRIFIMLLSLLALISVFNVIYVRRLGADMSYVFSDQLSLISRVSSLQRAFRPHALNTLYIEPGLPGNPELPWLFNRLAPSRRWTVIEALFPELQSDRGYAEFGIVRETFPRLIALGTTPQEESPSAGYDALPDALLYWDFRGPGIDNAVTIYDVSGHGRDIQIAGNEVFTFGIGRDPWRRTGIFTKDSPLVTFTDRGMPSGNSARTLLLWLQPYSPGRSVIFLYGDATKDSAFYVYQNESNLAIGVWGGGDVSGTTVLQPGEWYHVGIVHDGIVTSLFVNGVREATMIRTYNTGLPGRGYLGGRPGGDRFSGALGEVAVLGRALDDKQILASLRKR